MIRDLTRKAGAYARLLRLHRPIGIWLLLWPVLWALWLSSAGHPDPHVFLVFVAGTVLTRSAGCAINDFADRKFDGRVARTRDRPLVTGEVDPIEAVALCVALGFIALGLVLTLNSLTQLMALGGGILLLTYPLMKRFFPLPQLYLGAAFTWSVPMAYAAQTGTMPRIAWLLFLAGLVWTMAYDTMYAMADREDDRKLGLRSTATSVRRCRPTDHRCAAEHDAVRVVAGGLGLAPRSLVSRGAGGRCSLRDLRASTRSVSDVLRTARARSSITTISAWPCS